MFYLKTLKMSTNSRKSLWVPLILISTVIISLQATDVEIILNSITISKQDPDNTITGMDLINIEHDASVSPVVEINPILTLS